MICMHASRETRNRRWDVCVWKHLACEHGRYVQDEIWHWRGITEETVLSMATLPKQYRRVSAWLVWLWTHTDYRMDTRACPDICFWSELMLERMGCVAQDDISRMRLKAMAQGVEESYNITCYKIRPNTRQWVRLVIELAYAMTPHKQRSPSYLMRVL